MECFTSLPRGPLTHALPLRACLKGLDNILFSFPPLLHQAELHDLLVCDVGEGRSLAHFAGGVGVACGSFLQP
jgi:hypothetical protein